MPKNVFFTGQVPTAADFNSLAQDANMLATGGTIDGTVIGGTTPAAATATALTSTTSTTLASEAVVLTANNLPSGRPSLLLDFANSLTVDPRITFTRASTATRTNALGLLETVASGAPRIDYEPVTLACKGLLIEESRTNLLTYSEQLDNAAWTNFNTTGSAAAAVVAPDGLTTAEKLVESATTTTHYLYCGVTTSADSTFTMSVYAKAAERSIFEIRIADVGFSSGSRAYVTFDLSNSGAQVSGNISASSVTSGVVALGGGWFRCWLSATLAVTSTTTTCVLSLRTSAAAVSAGETYTGDGTSGLYVWGAQLEAGAFPTSYIPTVAAQVTRAADSASMTGANFSSWYRQGEGTFVVGADTSYPAATAGVMFIASDGTANERIQLSFGSSAIAPTVSVGGASQLTGLSESSASANTAYKTAFAYKLNDFAMSVGGSAVDTDTSGSVPATLTQLQIGHRTTYLNGHIVSIRFFPARLSNATLQALSTQ